MNYQLNRWFPEVVVDVQYWYHVTKNFLITVLCRFDVEAWKIWCWNDWGQWHHCLEGLHL